MQTHARDTLPVIAAQLRILAKRHGRTHPQYVAISAVFGEMCAEMRSHMAIIRDLTNDFTGPEQGCPTLRSALRDLEAFEREIERP